VLRCSYKQGLWVSWPHRILVQFIWIREIWSDRMVYVCEYSYRRFCAVFNFLISSNFARLSSHRRFSVLQITKVPSASLYGGLHPVVPGPRMRLIRRPPLHIWGLIRLSIDGSARVFSGPSPTMWGTSYLVDWFSLSPSPLRLLCAPSNLVSHRKSVPIFDVSWPSQMENIYYHHKFRLK
jgi:hypothetical protein